MKKMIYTLTMFVITLSFVCCNIDTTASDEAKTELVIQNQSSINIKEIKYSGFATEAEHPFVLVAGGAQETYLIRFTLNQDKSYSESMTMARLNVGADNDRFNLPSHGYKHDHRYKVVVTGDQVDDLTLRAIVDKGKIDLNRFLDCKC